MVSFKRPVLERKNKSPFSTWGFWFVLASEGGAGTCFVFAWSLPARWTAAAQPGPQTPSPMAWPEGPGTQACRTPPQRSRAVTRLACTVFPGLLPLSWTSPHPGSRPLLSPRPSLPSEDPASGVVARSGVGEAAPDRMAMTWDVETVTSASSSTASSMSCVRAAQGWSWVFFFFFFLLILPSFSKMGY